MRRRLTFYLAILYIIDVCRLYIYRLECFDFLKECTKFYHHTDILNGATHSVKFLNFVNFTKCALFSFCDLPLNLPCTAYIFYKPKILYQILCKIVNIDLELNVTIQSIELLLFFLDNTDI